MQSQPSLLPPIELVLRNEDGSPWVLRVSPGVERFIGYYSRLDGFGPVEDGLLRFTSAAD